MLSRRRLLAALPVPLLAAFARAERAGPAHIDALEIFRVEGRRPTTGEANRQYQTQPLHIYDEFRPAPYREPAPGQPGVANTSARYLRIRTKQGAEGLYGPIDAEAVGPLKAQLFPFLRGKDALAGEALWDQMHRLDRHSRAGHYMIALSAVDNCLWDLRGRALGVPVYRVLGGPTRTTVTAYGSTLGYSTEPDRCRATAARFKDAGFLHQKWFIPYGPGHGAEGMAANVALVRNLREAVGANVDLMFDAFSGWDLAYATEWCRQVEQYHPRWIEEAFHPDKLESFVALRRSTRIPVASGEHFYGRWEAHRYLQAGAISVVQADPEWCGGVSELLKICTIASAYDAQVIPHGHNLHTALHVVASQSPMTCPLVEYLINKMQSYYHFEQDVPHPNRGQIALPDRPGFGITLDQSRIEQTVPL